MYIAILYYNCLCDCMITYSLVYFVADKRMFMFTFLLSRALVYINTEEFVISSF